MIVTWRIVLLGFLCLAFVVRFRKALGYCIKIADSHNGFMSFLATVAIAILTYFLVNQKAY